MWFKFRLCVEGKQYVTLMRFTCPPPSGPDYVKQQLKEPVEIKEVPVEKKDSSPRDSPHFYRKGTTPPHSPATSPAATPPPSPQSSKKKGQLANNSTSRKTSKEEKPSRKISKEEKLSQKTSKDERSSRKLSKEERQPVTDGPKPSQAQIEAPPKPTKVQQPNPASVPPSQPPAIPVNGQLHTEYHSYYVKAPTRVPPPPEPEDPEEEPSALALARMPPQPPRSFSTPTPKPPSIRESKSDQKLRKQDSLKPKSLADTKKASMEIAESTEETVSDRMGKCALKQGFGKISDLNTHLCFFAESCVVNEKLHPVVD